MNAIKTARRLIEAKPESHAAQALAELVLSLESEGPFNLRRLYELDLKEFDLALQILAEWRIDRYAAGKAKLFDLSWQLRGQAQG